MSCIYHRYAADRDGDVPVCPFEAEDGRPYCEEHSELVLWDTVGGPDVVIEVEYRPASAGIWRLVSLFLLAALMLGDCGH